MQSKGVSPGKNIVIPTSAEISAENVQKADKAGTLGVGMMGQRERVATQGVETARGEAARMDQALGLHFQKVLFGQTLSKNAANEKHLQKMEQASEIIGTIERLPGNLKSMTAFRLSHLFRLYCYLFPNEDEREPVSDIKARVKDYPNGANADGGGFFSYGMTDKEGNVIAYSQGSTVPCDQGLFYYWQYGGVADRKYMLENYGKDSNPRENGILNTIHGVNAATLNAVAGQTNRPALGSIWESEPRGLGDTVGSIEFTGARLSIHNRAGGQVMMGVDANGDLVNLHLQPRLTPDSEPIALHMMFRPLAYEEGDELKRSEMNKADTSAMLMAWINNFRVEGFAEKDVAEAEAEISKRLASCERIVLLPASEVPDLVTLAEKDDILRQQVLDTYGVKSLEEGTAFYRGAMELATALRSCGAEVERANVPELSARFEELATRVRSSGDASEWPELAKEIETLAASIPG